jgi:hypothetical protein
MTIFCVAAVSTATPALPVLTVNKIVELVEVPEIGIDRDRGISIPTPGSETAVPVSLTVIGAIPE